MLETGAVVELVLPGNEAPTRATILSCSATMQSVRLQELQSQAVHRLSLKKLPFTVVQKPGQLAAEGDEVRPSAHGQPDAPQQTEQQQHGGQEAGGGGSAEEGGHAGRGEEQHQGAGSGKGASSEGEEDDDGGSSELGGEVEDAAEDDEEEGEEAAVLDAFPPATTAAIEAFAAAIETDPAVFLQPTAELAELAKGAAKALYDYQAGIHDSSGSSGSTSGSTAVLPELYIEGFDAEQIWLQLDLAAGPALRRARKLLKKAGQEPELLTPETEDAIDELLVGGSEEEPQPGSDDDGEEPEEQDADVAGVADLTDLDYDALLAAGAAHRQGRLSARSGSDDEEEQDEEEAAAQLAGSKRKRSAAAAAARAAVEDDHFKLDEMEAFLEQAEREAEGLDDDVEDKGGEPGSDEEEAALEALLDEAAAQTNRDKKKAKKARKKKELTFGEEQEVEDEEAENIGAAAMYEDFFGPRRGGQHGSTTVAAGGMRQQQDDTQGEGSEEEEEEEGFEDDLLSDDMISGEEDEREDGRPHSLANGAAAGEYSDEEEEYMEEGEEEEESGGRAAVLGSRRALLAASDEEEDEEDELVPSAHERRQQRMQEKIKKLEEAALAKKEWFMRGEIDAGHRPKNSALEVDLDFETTVKPPPQPTEEMTNTLDELIKRRIAEARFDDVVRIVAPPPETKRTTLELDDSKPQQARRGLGEIYEQEYMQTVAGVADDKDEEVRQAAHAQFSALCTKLDALSHLHFTPRPVIEEVTVKVDVPAIMMEEAAPQFVSSASMRAPEEVFASEAAGLPRAEEELSREDRKRRRAQRKRVGKKRRTAKEEERAARAISQGGTAALANRRSAAAEEAARKLEKAAKKGRRGSDTSRKGEYTKSTNVFSKIQQHADGMAVLGAAAPAPRAAHLKL